MFGNENCTECNRFRTNPVFGASAQLKFVDRNPKRCRNRCKINANFLATLPETEEHEQNKIQLEPDTVHFEPVTVHLKPDSVETNLRCEQQTGKLQKGLADLRVSTLPIPDQVRKRLVEVVKENLDAFAASPIDLGQTSVVVHTFKTGAAKPFRHKLRPIHCAGRQYLEQAVEKLLSIGAISEADPGACPYASRTVTTPKKDGSVRMCVDYRDINAQTEKDVYPLPRIYQVWPVLSKAQYFASIDLLMGYHQVEVNTIDPFKTAFVTLKRLYIYNIMPFGLCNAPATFQRLMEKILGTIIAYGVLVYLDDVLIYEETAEEILDKLSQVLKLLAKAGVKCKASKCSVLTQKVHYFGRTHHLKGRHQPGACKIGEN